MTGGEKISVSIAAVCFLVGTFLGGGVELHILAILQTFTPPQWGLTVRLGS